MAHVLASGLLVSLLVLHARARACGLVRALHVPRLASHAYSEQVELQVAGVLTGRRRHTEARPVPVPGSWSPGSRPEVRYSDAVREFFN